MSDTLATLIDKVQIILGDSAGTYFSDTTRTAAIRQALSEWNMQAPIYKEITITPDDNTTYEYELTAESGAGDACEIIDVLIRHSSDTNVEAVSVDFEQYVKNASDVPHFRLRTPATTSDRIVVRFTEYHTINGLDSETVSTLPARHDQAIVDGGAFFAIMIRAASRVETINLSPDQTDNYRELANGFGAMFAQRLSYARRNRQAPVSEPESRTWAEGEKYNNWET